MDKRIQKRGKEIATYGTNKSKQHPSHPPHKKG